jgi:hypothetical protein
MSPFEFHPRRYQATYNLSACPLIDKNHSTDIVFRRIIEAAHLYGHKHSP